MRLSHLRSVAALIAVSALACSGGSKSVSNEGEISISTNAIANGQQIGVKEVIFVISPGGALAPAPADRILAASTKDGITYQARIGRFPVGSYTVFGYAYDSIGNDPRDPAQQPATAFAAFIAAPAPLVVNPGLAASATLALQQNAALLPPDGFANSAPFINFVTASSANVESTDGTAVGTVLNLAANVTDLDGIADIIDVVWSDSLTGVNFVSSGLPSAAGAISAIWTPPAGFAGAATITLAVTDSKGALSSLSISVNVTKASAKGGPVSIFATINNWPDLTGMNLTNGLVLPGQTAGFSATAVDPDGDAVSFAWLSSCGGTFAPGVGSAPGLDVVTFTAPLTSGPCTITVNVSDGKGGSTSGQTAILVKQPMAFQPEFTVADIAPTANVGQAVEFAVEAVQYDYTGAFVFLPFGAFTFSDVVTPSSNPFYAPTTFVGSWTVPAAVCTGQLPGAVVTATLNATATGTPANAGDPIPATIQALNVSVTCP